MEDLDLDDVVMLDKEEITSPKEGEQDKMDLSSEDPVEKNGAEDLGKKIEPLDSEDVNFLEKDTQNKENAPEPENDNNDEDLEESEMKNELFDTLLSISKIGIVSGSQNLGTTRIKNNIKKMISGLEVVE